MKANIPVLTIAAAACTLLSLPSAASQTSVVEFDREEARKLGWRIVDDGVMGGLSKGKMEISESGILRFSGNLSLENNGGFSSLRTDDLELDLSGAEGLIARVKGDGRNYQLRLSTDERYRGMQISFKKDFSTKKGKWTEVKVPFEQFEGSFRGMSLKDRKFDPAKIERLGLLLGDKKAGPFQLEVDWIVAYGNSDSAKSVVDLALADERFKTLTAALTEAKLVETLNGSGPFTVFAPTDEAFSKLPKGTVEELLKPENRAKLQSILKYHVIPGSVDLAAGLKAGEASSVQGEALSIEFAEGRVRVNEATLLDANITASNGVIHVIDSVLLPPAPKNDLASVAERAGSFGTLLAGVEAAGLSDVLTEEGPLTILAPTDEAFAKLPKGTLKTLLKKENRDQLVAILSMHAIKGTVTGGDALNAKRANSVSGEKLQFSIEAGSFKVNGATILKTDITCDNGVIHVIDEVLLPGSTSKEKQKPATAKTIAPDRRIEGAIEKGVPVFNQGDHEKCADIYRDCLTSLASDRSLDDSVRQSLSDLIKRADHAKPTERAWLFRAGLDRVLASLTQ
ncbi:CIA30 family protein [Haloferula sp.]|uniref:CIA30 family protein n=1 Tax=Haloferula sp. TaxID=2497595 RepID=UPI00329BACD4